jgi:hypothetical protein
MHFRVAPRRSKLVETKVARKGVGWAEKPWVPPIQVAEMRTRKV